MSSRGSASPPGGPRRAALDTPLRGGRFTVVGAAKSGIAAANALARRGADVLLVDIADKPRPAGLDAAVAYQGGTNAVRPGDTAVLSPGIPEVSPVRAEIAAAAGEVIGEVELFFRLCPAPVLAVTGTDGKSTTTTMLGDIVAASGRHTWVGGNLGTPLCQGLDAITEQSVVVAEVSGFQLTTCDTFRPRVAVITNIAHDHLDYHGGFEPYQAAKRRIWQRMEPGDVLIVNADDPYIARWDLPRGPEKLTFSTSGREDADGRLADGILWVSEQGQPVPLMPRGALPVPGRHNVANALAAAQAAVAFGVDVETARAALRVYRGLPHRLQWVAEIDGVVWIDDSKATNPNAASAGLAAMERPTVLLAGGSDKGSDFSAYGALLRQKTRAVVLFGETRQALADAIGPDHPVTLVADLAAAVEVAGQLARPGDAVLLSPACASFDQFRDFVHRGQVFQELVQAQGSWTTRRPLAVSTRDDRPSNSAPPFQSLTLTAVVRGRGGGNRLALCESGRVWVTAYADRLHFWRDGALEDSAYLRGRRVREIRFGPDSSRLLVAPYHFSQSEHALIEPPQLEASLGAGLAAGPVAGNYEVRQAAWSPEGRVLLVYARFRPARARARAKSGGGQPKSRLLLLDADGALIEVLREDPGGLGAMHIGQRWIAYAGDRLHCWRRRGLEATATVDIGPVGLRGLAMAAGGDRLVGLAADGHLIRLAPDGATRPPRWRGHEGEASGLVAHPTRPVVLSGGDDGWLRAWSVDAAEPVLLAECRLGGRIDAVAVDADGEHCLAGNPETLWLCRLS